MNRLSERDICTKFITPAILQAGWTLNQFREEVTLTAGRIRIQKNLASRITNPNDEHGPRRADYVLYYKPNVPIAVLEAKDATHSVGSGMQQAIKYSQMLGVPFAFSSNGRAFLFHNPYASDGIVEREIPMNEFPSPETLWAMYSTINNLTPESEKTILQDYHLGSSNKTPRYYQMVAINKTLEAIARGQNRLLLVMATGTGKTYTAFQIIWRLWKSRTKKRILFLADRNILVDQTMSNDFKPFGSAMTKIRDRKADPSYEIYLALYQALTGTEASKDIFLNFSPDFFDLIIIDECHRGSPDEEGLWHRILDHFSSATHLGMTATPKETEYVSNIDYFGPPVYTYSLKQGIQDGFLAPYRVVRIDFDRDLEGFRPERGQKDKNNNEIEDRIYYQSDFDRTLVLEKRTTLVAKKITDFLTATDPLHKTIVFCEDIDHAERMRQAIVNCNPDQIRKSEQYVMCITGDNKEGKAQLDNFIFPEKTYPVIATTSKLMTTGVDAQTCHLIVLDKTIRSMTEFKQIIGRGTRINEDYNKYYFTIMDFKKATEHFADPDFDGEPVQIFVPDSPDASPVPPEVYEPGDEINLIPAEDPRDYEPLTDTSNNKKRMKYYVNNVSVQVIAERDQYFDPSGKLITESLRDYTRRAVTSEFESMDAFLKYWTAAEKKQIIISHLQQEGVLFEALAEDVGRELDPLDLILHVVWDQPPLTRSQRVKKVRETDYFSKYSEPARRVLDSLLDKYADQGVIQIEEPGILNVDPFPGFGTVTEIIKSFGGLDEYNRAVRELEKALYCA